MGPRTRMRSCCGVLLPAFLAFGSACGAVAETRIEATRDNSIVLYARDYGAKTLPAAEFAAKLGPSVPNLGPNTSVKQEAPLSPTEVAEWEEYFRKGRQGKDGKG